MADMLEYLAWRGDILFSQLGLNEVDALIFSTLSYIRYDGILSQDLNVVIPLETVYKVLMAQPDPQNCCRHEKDLALLQAAAESDRFGQVGLTFYRSVFDPQEEVQFAAVTFLLDDGTSLLAFRGTDSTLVGWKEDFNMSFRRSVPAQRLAQEYVQRYASFSPAPMHLAGHSKGGNLAVYAAAFCKESLQLRIKKVYSHDSPGFLPHVLQSPGMSRILPRVEKTLPQSSVVGLLLEHQEALKIVKSRSVSVLQHDPFNWTVEDGAFVVLEQFTRDARHLDRTLSAWLQKQDHTQRERIVDALFGILETTDVRTFSEFRTDWQKTIPAVAREVIHLDSDTRTMLFRALKELAALSFKTLPQTLKDKE